MPNLSTLVGVYEGGPHGYNMCTSPLGTPQATSDATFFI